MKRSDLALAALASACALAALPSAAGASTQLFKCVEGGRTVYQQQGCPVSAQAEPPAAPPPAALKVDAASTPASRRLKPASAPASSVPATPR
jgi:hypothetical protein